MKPAALASLLLMMASLWLPAQTSQGPLNPGTLGNNNTTCPFAYGSVVHLSPAANSATSNNVYSSAAHCDCCDTQTSCLEARNYGFSIPGTATILGIRVEVERRRSAGLGGYIEDNGVMLLRSGTYVGTNKAAYGTNWPTTDAYATYGGSTDLWGTTWTPADINSANFGVSLASISYTCGSAMTSFVDHIRITVFYDNTLGQAISGFTARPEDGGVRVSWGFPQGSAVQALQLERALGEEPFARLADLQPACTSYLDAGAAGGAARYRLLWQDADGNQGMSQVAEVAQTVEAAFSMAEKDGEVLVTLSHPASAGTVLLLHNAAGTLVRREGIAAGETTHRMHVEGLAAGMYVARLAPFGEVVKWMKRPE